MKSVSKTDSSSNFSTAGTIRSAIVSYLDPTDRAPDIDLHFEMGWSPSGARCVVNYWSSTAPGSTKILGFTGSLA